MALITIDFPKSFKQARSGLNKKIFYMFKFRTMDNESDKNRNILYDKMRLTVFGKFLRSTSLDQFPEMWSVIKGDIPICYADCNFALEKIGWCAECDLNEYSKITTKE